MSNKKASKFGINGELIANKIITPRRIEDLFIQALGEVLEEMNSKDNNKNLNNKGDIKND
jgi:hypothetical protein